MPSVGDHQILLRVRAASLQRTDVEALETLNAQGDQDLGFGFRDRDRQIVGADAAGDVVAVGRGVQSVAIGDRVASLYFYDFVDGLVTAERQKQGRGEYTDGVFGDYVLVEGTGVAPIPNYLSYEEAATASTAGLTAWMATVGGNFVKPKDTVLIQGTGGISMFALQFALAAGARTIVTSGSATKLAQARALGAHEGINYRECPNWSDRVLELTQRRGADLVVDMGGRATLEESVKSVAYYGTIALVGGVGGYDGALPALPLILKLARAQGIYTGSRADYLRMAQFMTQHRVRPVIGATYDLEQYPQAVFALKSGELSGRIVMRLK